MMTVMPGKRPLSEHRICSILLKFGGVNVQQLELKFFWPLQEQMKLDLDYPTELYGYGIRPNPAFNIANNGFISSNISGGVFTINTDQVVFYTKRPQNFLRRLLYRLLKLRVEQI